jgi:hypothetical protein
MRDVYEVGTSSPLFIAQTFRDTRLRRRDEGHKLAIIQRLQLGRTSPA